MKHTILEPSYEARFVDKMVYPPHIIFYLRGLAAAIQDTDPCWRPVVTELAEILKKAQKSSMDKLINAGASYGAAKQIDAVYAGPAILLFGAAIQAIGEGIYPNKELEGHIAAGKRKLVDHGLGNDEDLNAILEAARQRASFDKVSELMRNEFSKGLKSAKYPDELIAKIVPKIVNITHDVRHRGVIDKNVTHILEPNKKYMFKGPSGRLVGGGIYTNPQYYESLGDMPAIESLTIEQNSCDGIIDPFTEVMLMPLVGGTLMITSEFNDLLQYARVGCAHRILNCINKYR